MDGLGPDGVLRHDVPTHWVMRMLLIGGGAAILALTGHELWRAVWPPNLFSLPFLAIIIGAALVGVPMIGAGLFAPSVGWAVSRGLVEITKTTPFSSRLVRIAAESVDELRVREDDNDGVPNFRVELIARDGTRYTSREFQSHDTAATLRRNIEAVLYA